MFAGLFARPNPRIAALEAARKLYVAQINGYAGDTAEAVIAGDCRRGLELIDAIASEGKELKFFLSDWIGYLRAILLAHTLGGDERSAGVSAESWKAVRDQGARMPRDRSRPAEGLSTKFIVLGFHLSGSFSR